MPRFQFSVRIVVHARQVHGFGAMALCIVVVGWKVEIGCFARALFLFDVFGAAAAIACRLRGDAVVFAVGHVDDSTLVKALLRKHEHVSSLRSVIECDLAVVDISCVQTR